MTYTLPRSYLGAYIKTDAVNVCPVVDTMQVAILGYSPGDYGIALLTAPRINQIKSPSDTAAFGDSGQTGSAGYQRSSDH